MSFVAQSKTDHIHTSLSQSEKDELYFKILISMIQSNPATWGVGGGVLETILVGRVPLGL